MHKPAITDWYIWPLQTFPGAFNMQMDHLLARQMGQVMDKPILRFFTWNPYCISLGYHQDPSDINHDLCRRHRIELVRRPTGGRAILHAEELTYSVIYPYHELEIGAVYKLIHIPFVQALIGLEIPAVFESVQADFRRIYKTDRSFLCFATSAKHEVEIDGKKLIGSAQRIYDRAILQHGSVLLGDYHQKLIDFLILPDERRSRMRKYIRDHTTHIWKFRKSVSAESLAREIQSKFQQLYGIRFIDYQENKRLRNMIQDHQDNSEFSIIQQQDRESARITKQVNM